MRSRTVRQILRWMLLVGLAGACEFACAASATAIITANIVEITPEHNGLRLSSNQLDVRSSAHDNLTITNLSSQWQAVNVTLEAPGGNGTGCGLRYSPTGFSIPPGGYQVLRIARLAAHGATCPPGYQLIITGQQGPMMFEVPVYTAQQ